MNKRKDGREIEKPSESLGTEALPAFGPRRRSRFPLLLEALRETSRSATEATNELALLTKPKPVTHRRLNPSPPLGS